MKVFSPALVEPLWCGAPGGPPGSPDPGGGSGRPRAGPPAAPSQSRSDPGAPRHMWGALRPPRISCAFQATPHHFCFRTKTPAVLWVRCHLLPRLRPPCPATLHRIPPRLRYSVRSGGPAFPLSPDPPLTYFPSAPSWSAGRPQPRVAPRLVSPSLAPRHRPASPLCPASSFRSPSTRAPRAALHPAPLSARAPAGRGLTGGSARGAGGRDRPRGWEPWAGAAAGAAVAAVAARAAAGAGGLVRGPGSACPSAEPCAGLGLGPGARRWRWRCRCCCCCSLGPRLPPLATAERAVSERGPAGPIPGARAGARGEEAGGAGPGL